MAVVDEQTLFEVGLPGVGIAGVEQRRGICDVCESVVVFFFSNRVWEMSRWVDVAV